MWSRWEKEEKEEIVEERKADGEEEAKYEKEQETKDAEKSKQAVMVKEGDIPKSRFMISMYQSRV